MHQIAEQLPDYDCWFSQIFTDSKFLKLIIKYTSIADTTIMAGQFRRRSEEYLSSHNLQIDFGGKRNKYDLVVYCSDLIIADSLRDYKTIWVQEGMIDKLTPWSKVVKALRLPTYLAGNTSLNGSANSCDIYCAASVGYKNYFTSMGTDSDRIFATGMPNYDHCSQYLDNDFPYRDYVMVATTDMRETYRKEDRPAFIKQTVEIANGRPMLFKLHPNENFERANTEVRKHAPAGTMVYQSGNTNHMIANCSELITQYSTVVYTGLALGKKVHSYFDLDELKRLAPLQNGGTSAKNIAKICRAYVEFEGKGKDFLRQYVYRAEDENILEELYA